MERKRRLETSRTLLCICPGERKPRVERVGCVSGMNELLWSARVERTQECPLKMVYLRCLPPSFAGTVFLQACAILRTRADLTSLRTCKSKLAESCHMSAEHLSQTTPLIGKAMKILSAGEPYAVKPMLKRFLLIHMTLSVRTQAGALAEAALAMVAASRKCCLRTCRCGLDFSSPSSIIVTLASMLPYMECVARALAVGSYRFSMPDLDLHAESPAT